MRGHPGTYDMKNSTDLKEHVKHAGKHPQGISALRVQGKPRDGYSAWCLTVPAQIARLLPASMQGALFTCELNADGILFRPLLPGVDNGVPRPEWVKTLSKDGG